MTHHENVLTLSRSYKAAAYFFLIYILKICCYR